MGAAPGHPGAGPIILGHSGAVVRLNSNFTESPGTRQPRYLCRWPRLKKMAEEPVDRRHPGHGRSWRRRGAENSPKQNAKTRVSRKHLLFADPKMASRGVWYTNGELPKHEPFSYVIDSKTVTTQILSSSLVFNNFHL